MNSKPLAIDLYAGLGGWTDGLLAEGYDVVGFDIEQHAYGTQRYPAQLVLQDVLTLHGSQFRDAALIVASPPCQRYSYMAMPWSQAKAQAAEIRESLAKLIELNRLFWACFDLHAQAIRAAGRHIPLIVENVKGAQPWVGRAKAHYGSYYLWGGVESVGGRIVASGPVAFGQASVRAATRGQKVNPDGTAHPQGSWFAIADSQKRGVKAAGNDTYAIDGRPCGKLTDPRYPSGTVKQHGSGPEWWDKALDEPRKGNSRKAASAMIAKIPFDLASYIARAFKPQAGGGGLTLPGPSPMLPCPTLARIGHSS